MFKNLALEDAWQIKEAKGKNLRGATRIVEAHEMRGTRTDEPTMLCAVGLFNGAIKLSHFYYVWRNPHCAIWKPLPYPKKFHWLNTSTMQLDPFPSSVPEELSSAPGMFCQSEWGWWSIRRCKRWRETFRRCNAFVRTDVSLKSSQLTTSKSFEENQSRNGLRRHQYQIRLGIVDKRICWG